MKEMADNNAIKAKNIFFKFNGWTSTNITINIGLQELHKIIVYSGNLWAWIKKIAIENYPLKYRNSVYQSALTL